MTFVLRFAISSSLALAALVHATVTRADDPKPAHKKRELKEEKKEDHWYERIHIRGYTRRSASTTARASTGSIATTSTTSSRA
jgi:hypothetical protein